MIFTAYNISRSLDEAGNNWIDLNDTGVWSPYSLVFDREGYLCYGTFGYGVYCTEQSTVTTLRVSIDIKPGEYPNTINLGSKGVVPVAILSSEGFDATTVDPLSVTLAGAKVRLKGKGTPMASIEDLNGDGMMDLVVHVETKALQLTTTSTEAILEGKTYSRRRIRGSDSVLVK